MTAQEIFNAVSAAWKSGDLRHPSEVVGPRPVERRARWIWDVLASSMESYRFPKEVDRLLRKAAHTCHLDDPSPYFQ